MSTTQIGNPAGAYAEPSTVFDAAQPSINYCDLVNTNGNSGGTIHPGQAVIIDIANPPNGQATLSLHTSAPKLLLGISLDLIPAGSGGRIQTWGLAPQSVGVLAGTGGVTVGDLLTVDGTIDGRLVTASSPTDGQVIGVAMNTATVGTALAVWVFKV